MNVNFNGFNENAATFLAANTITAVGQPVKPSAEGAGAKCASGDAFCGIVTGLRGQRHRRYCRHYSLIIRRYENG